MNNELSLPWKTWISVKVPIIRRDSTENLKSTTILGDELIGSNLNLESMLIKIFTHLSLVSSFTYDECDSSNRISGMD